MKRPCWWWLSVKAERRRAEKRGAAAARGRALAVRALSAARAVIGCLLARKHV